MKLRDVYSLTRDAAVQWWGDNAPRLGAALAFYTLLSLSPLILVAVGILGMICGQQTARQEIIRQTLETVGPAGAEVVRTVLSHAASTGAGIAATVVGSLVLLFSATGVFAALQNSLNTLWNAHPPSSGGVWALVKDRLLSFALVLGMAFLLLLSLLAHTVLTSLGGFLHQWLGNWTNWLWVLNGAISLGVAVLLFALVFKLLPAVELSWRDVWFGAIVTAVLFTVGRFLIGLYLRFAAAGSAYGAAGSLVVLLLWVYYSTQILFFGAELTRLYADRHGSGLHPQDAAPRHGAPGRPGVGDGRARQQTAAQEQPS
jgi:membrane protein